MGRLQKENWMHERKREAEEAKRLEAGDSRFKPEDKRETIDASKHRQ